MDPAVNDWHALLDAVSCVLNAMQGVLQCPAVVVEGIYAGLSTDPAALCCAQNSKHAAGHACLATRHPAADASERPQNVLHLGPCVYCCREFSVYAVLSCALGFESCQRFRQCVRQRCQIPLCRGVVCVVSLVSELLSLADWSCATEETSCHLQYMAPMLCLADRD